MELSTYEYLTGTTVPTSDLASVRAQIRRTQKILEGLLGFTLDPELVNKNLHNEEGKTSQECSCPDVEPESLDDPDPVIGAYRLFNYNPNDQFFHIDPFYTVHAVKLVNRGVTIKTFDDLDYRPQYAEDWGKYLENCQGRLCSCSCTDCVQLAVDADWLPLCDSSLDSSIGCVPEDLLYIWADMITYEVDCKKDVKSESIGAHSYTKFERKEPQRQPENIAVLKKYAGPRGTLTKVIVP